MNMDDKSLKDGKIRESIIDGIFYSSEAEELTAQIESLLKESKKKAGEAFAIISPHAGYEYAGRCIASAMKSVTKRKIKDIVILAPVHNNPIDQVILPESKFFLTPLGSLAVNQDKVEELLTCSTGIVLNDIPHLEEHCIEVQLPFIKHLYPHAKIIPILLGSPSSKNIKILSNALQVCFGGSFEETLFIVTANMTSNISGTDSQKEAEALISLIEAHDEEGIKEGIKNKKISSCGAGCIATLLSFKNIEYDVNILDRESSESAGGDNSKIVYYAAIAFNID